jgi:SAM-dependent methyltransferase
MTSARLAAHWVDIGPERMERYERMYVWNPATEHYYTAAQLGAGQAIGDFGCGPGHAAVAYARLAGPDGHVHAFDINAEFIRRTAARAEKAGLADRITAHLLAGTELPLADAALDRIVARNTLIYVPDPVATRAEFRRVLRPGGLAHAIEGDWGLSAVEPIPTSDWRALIEGVGPAFPHPEIGRQLHGHFRAAGFADVAVQVLTMPDSTGRLRAMLDAIADMARDGGMDPDRIDRTLALADAGLADGRYLVVAPQFVVTATA